MFLLGVKEKRTIERNVREWGTRGGGGGRERWELEKKKEKKAINEDTDMQTVRLTDRKYLSDSE